MIKTKKTSAKKNKKMIRKTSVAKKKPGAKNAVGRPKGKTLTAKSKHISVRVTPSEHKLISKLAKTRRMSITKYVVDRLNSGIAQDTNNKSKLYV